jgi:phosphoenolpyruvate carboxykinase (ATP)
MIEAEGPLRRSLDDLGLTPSGDVFWNLAPATLVEHALSAGDTSLASSGALVVNTAPHTGRSPRDRYVVREPSSEADIWWGTVNVALDEASFAALRAIVVRDLESNDIYVQERSCGAAEAHALAVKVVTASPWHALFAHNMFLSPRDHPLEEWVVLHSPRTLADPARHGTRTGTFVVLHLARHEVLIGGTAYAGEIKKSIFSVMNYRLPAAGALPMHCSANVGAGGDVALFFGLSGTGKTSLSTDQERPMIGDDEHGWDQDGVFNFEGGSYAKVIRISETDEPLIYSATNSFGTIVENVVLDPTTRTVDFGDDSVTENTRSSYPLSYLRNIVPSGTAGHATNIAFLAADAFGVLPPISRLTADQASYYFLAGYTAKLAGTEAGVVHPEATFSPCFGAPFLPRPPRVYAELLRERIERHATAVWLVNTGWTGGPVGVGSRVPIRHTRAMLHAALSGQLEAVPRREHEVFGLSVPVHVPGVPDELLDVRATWSNQADYDAAALDLARRFAASFAAFEADVSPAVRAAGPRLS